MFLTRSIAKLELMMPGSLVRELVLQSFARGAKHHRPAIVSCIMFLQGGTRRFTSELVVSSADGHPTVPGSCNVKLWAELCERRPPGMTVCISKWCILPPAIKSGWPGLQLQGVDCEPTIWWSPWCEPIPGVTAFTDLTRPVLLAQLFKIVLL
jgi:hypothetical protein